MNDENIKLLLSQAVDGEILSDHDNAAIQSALKNSAELRAYEAQLLRLKQALDLWPKIESSADWENKMDKSMARLGIKEEKKMSRFKLPEVSRMAVLLVIFVIVGGILLQQYAQRGIQGRLRDAAKYMSGQTAELGTTTQYEPYYQSSNYNIMGTQPQVISPSKSIATEIADRKIIRTVDLKILVKNYLAAQQAITNTVKKFDGLVLNSQVNKYDNGSNGNIIFQVLPTNLDMALMEIKSFGEVQSETSKADDVTGQYVDTEARLGNMRTIRDRLSVLAAEKPGKVSDLLEVERELSRVTGEIEAMEARLKYLSQVSAMATVTVSFYEKAIVPVAKGFSVIDSFRGTLRTALEAALNTFNAIIIVIGFLLPVVFWSLLFWGGYWVWKKLRK